MRIAFLLGAGVSLPAGMASTQAITDAVLRVEDYTLQTDGSFSKADIGVAYSWAATKPRLCSLVQTVMGYCREYFDAENAFRVVNYEDLFFAMSQMREHLSEEYENPALEAFTRKVLNRLNGHCSSDGRKELRELADLVCNYILDVISMELSRMPSSLEHLTCLVDAMLDQDFKGCDVFTLNHDLLIERVLKTRGLDVVDGFGSPEQDVAWWDPERFNRSARHYFLKLHGSINWWQYEGRLAKTPRP